MVIPFIIFIVSNQKNMHIELDNPEENHIAQKQAENATHIIVTSADDSYGVGEILIMRLGLCIVLHQVPGIGEPYDSSGLCLRFIDEDNEDRELVEVPIFKYRFIRL